MRLFEPMTAIVRDGGHAQPRADTDAFDITGERLRLALASIKDHCIFMLDPEGHVRSWNSGAEKIIGYQAEEILTQHFSRFYPRADIARSDPQNALMAAARNGHFEAEGLCVRKDGSEFPAEFVTIALRDDARAPHGFIKVVRDVTSRKRAEDEVRRLNAELDCRLAGVAKASRTSEQDSGLDCGAEATEPLPRTIVDSTVEANVSTSIKVNGINHAEEIQPDLECQLREAVNNAPIIMATLNRDAVFTTVEGSSLRGLGREPASIRGHSLYEFHRHDSATAASVRRALAGESCSITAELTGRVFEIWCAPRRDASGAVVGATTISTDVTDRALAERELRRRISQQAAIADLGTRALVGVDTCVLAKEAVDVAATMLGVDLSSMLRVGPDGQLFIQAVNGTKGAPVVGLPVPSGEDSIGGYTVRCGRPVVVENLATESRFKHSPRLREYGAVSGISAAIAGAGQSYGVLAAFSRMERAFTKDDATFIQSLANIIAAAIAREQVEDKLRRSEEYSRSLIENSSDVVAVLNGDGFVRYVGGPVKQMFGFELAEMVGRNSSELVHPDDLELTQTVFQRARENPGVATTVECRCPTADGSWRVCGIIVKAVADIGGEPGIILNARDVTERKQAEADQALLASIVESSDDAIASVVIDQGVRITSWNQGAERLYGYTAAEVMQRSPDVFYPPGAIDEMLDYIERIKRGEGVQRFEARRRHRNGTTVDVSITLSPMYNAQERIVGAAVIGHDISARKQAERELAAARDAALESARLKSAFLANMSHEIRTPINIILGYSELVSEYLNEHGDLTQASYLDAISRAGKRLLATISGILDYSKIESGSYSPNPQKIQLARLVEHEVESVRIAAAEKGLALSFEISETHATVVADEYCLTHALSILIQNAIKFTEEGGIALRLYRDGDGMLCIDVADTGIGIDPEFLPRLLEPFSQEDSGFARRFEGSGLGLALARRYLDIDHSTLAIKSEKGHGSTFTIRFARTIEVAPQPARHAHLISYGTEDGSRDRPVILVVEDDADNQAFMQVIMRNRYTLLMAASAEEVRALIESYAGEFSLVLMDLSLRGDEDGLTLTRRLKSSERFRTTPIIALTAYTSVEDRQLALAAGCDGFLTKPLERATFFAAIDGYLARNGAHR